MQQMHIFKTYTKVKKNCWILLDVALLKMISRRIRSSVGLFRLAAAAATTRPITPAASFTRSGES